jgi:hypothetical protein
MVDKNDKNIKKKYKANKIAVLLQNSVHKTLTCGKLLCPDLESVYQN